MEALALVGQSPEPPTPVPLAGTAIHPVTRWEAVSLIINFASAGRSSLVVTPNVDHVVTLRRDAAFREAYAVADLRVCDGAPLLLLSRLCGRRLPERVTGADILVDVCRSASGLGLRVFIAGGAPAVLERGIWNLRATFPSLRVEGWSPPYDFEGTVHDLELQRRLAGARPDIVFVCIGAPRAEIWSAHQLAHHRAVFICAGAAIDFAAGARLRAPRWMQQACLEWVYRLSREPRRLWRRYLVRDPAFLPIAVAEVVRARLHLVRSAT